VTNLLEVRGLHVWFDSSTGSEVHAVRGVELTVQEGERVGLVGESGCGKTTTILAMMGLLPSTASAAGQVLLNGADILATGERSVRPHRWTDIAMVFQGAMNSFNPVRRVSAQIAEVLQVRGGESARSAKQRSRELLRMVGIPADRMDRFPHEFSGGMRQRAAIALAVACAPKVLLADEPTTALDVMVQAQVIELLDRLCDEQELALVLVSHDLPLVAQVCERVSVMYAGEVVESGPVDQLSQNPAHPYTRLLFAATPDVEDESELASIPGTPPLLDHEVTGCAFAPRCDRAFHRCEIERPVLRQVGIGRFAACHLNDVAADDLSGSTTEPSGRSGITTGPNDLSGSTTGAS
jgi:oligopeptide/dipeptide ABC transporter ATP-binding protein